MAVNLGIGSPYPLAAEIGAALGFPVTIENESGPPPWVPTRACAFGETHRRAS